MKKYMMALDQGTTSSRCILFDKEGNIVSRAQQEFRQIYPQPGWVEHDPMDIWSSQLAVARLAMEKAGASAEEIAAIGITNQRETTIVWDKETGEPVYNAIVWQCRRTSGVIDTLDEETRQQIRRKTGLVPDAYFSATKIGWILEHVEDARRKAEAGELLFGTVDTWLMWNLSGGSIHATDYTNASRTMLFDIHTLSWDRELLDLFQIPVCMMPEVYPSGYRFGVTDKKYFGEAVPITGAAGDQQASLFGLSCFEEGDAKNTYGTGCFMLLHTGRRIVESENGLVSTIICGFTEKAEYALEGSVFIGGAVIQWLRDEMKLVAAAPESEKAARTVADTNGAYLVPAFTGLGAPHWDQDARGTLVGLTRGFGKEHMIRAALESIAYQVSDVLEAMKKDSGMEIRMLKADGGASRNDFLMQFQADILGTRIERSKMAENTAFGAAAIAGLTAGFWKEAGELKERVAFDETFVPAMEETERAERIRGWSRAVRTAEFWAKEK